MIIYNAALREIAIALGLLYLVVHLLPLLKPFYFQDLLQKFPRSIIAGYITTSICTLWVASLLSLIDLGEYNKFRTLFVFATLTGGLLSSLYIRDFLSIRGLGGILLLGANVILDGAFLIDTPFKIPFVINAYLWILLGIPMVSSPYLFRNAIQWSTAILVRWKTLMFLGLTWGIIALGLGLFYLP